VFDSESVSCRLRKNGQHDLDSLRLCHNQDEVSPTVDYTLAAPNMARRYDLASPAAPARAWDCKWGLLEAFMDCEEKGQHERQRNKDNPKVFDDVSGDVPGVCGHFGAWVKW
jgi:hypothetical protein